MSEIVEKRNITKHDILKFMMLQGSTTKTELSNRLNISMPTVLSNINDLMARGLVLEAGEMESTGGRKARKISLNENYCFAIGVNITAHHLSMVLLNLRGEAIRQQRMNFDFRSDGGYCRELAKRIQDFYKDIVDEDKILGVGISLPGIIHDKKRILSKSHALCLENYSLKLIEQLLPFPVYFENDANAAMLAEDPMRIKNAVYLFLNNTLGGAVCINGRLLSGENRKAGEFGHMLLVPGGKRCYCGKAGCADAYCATSVLTENGKYSLKSFMESLGKDEKADKIWEEYMEKLAILISNIRMIFDMDIILGGDVGGYLSEYMVELNEKVSKYNLFDLDGSYLKNCSYREEASAVGVAKHFFRIFTEQNGKMLKEK